MRGTGRLRATRRRQSFFAATVAAIVTCAVAAAAAGAAAPGWTTYGPAGLPVKLDLPSNWSSLPPLAGTRFYAVSGKEAYVELAVSAFHGKAADFVSSESVSVRKAYLALDPKAKLRSRTVSLPAGQAFEVIARITVHKMGAPDQALSIYDYSFLKKARVYEFPYAADTTKAGAYVGTFDTSVRTIRLG